MVLTKIEDLLTIDTESNKAQDNKNLLKKLKQLIKEGKSQEVDDQNLAEELPFTGVSVVGDKFVTLKFDLESRKAVVESAEYDSRDIRGRNYMAMYKADNALKKLGKEQK